MIPRDKPLIISPYSATTTPLTGLSSPVTVVGGRAGAVVETESPKETGDSPQAHVRNASSADAESMRNALDALTAMFSGYLGSDRKLLDEGFEDLVGILEEWRDAVPKA